MAVADQELDAEQAATVQVAQEFGPEGLGPRGADLQSEFLALAVGVHTQSHYHRQAHDATGLAKMDGSHLNLIRHRDGHPTRSGRRRAAARYGLRPSRLAAH